MKSLLIAIVTASLICLSLNGCKKGAGDPFLSFHSRKARVVGEWNIDYWKEEISSKETQSWSSTINEKYTFEINKGNIRIDRTSTDGIETYFFNLTGSVTATIIFSKDGTFEKTIKYDNLKGNYSASIDSGTMLSSKTKTTLGTWNFLGGIEKDEFKNKERIVLNILNETTTEAEKYSNGINGSSEQTYSYANGVNTEIWHLQTLKNKELIMDGIINNKYSDSSSGTFSGGSSSSKSTYTESGTINGTLSQK